MLCILSSRPNFLSLSYIRCQPQSRTSGSTSHLPFLAPPQGPLMSHLVQAVRGQMPPVRSSTQSPHSRHRSLPRHSPRVPPTFKVLAAGWTRSEEHTSELQSRLHLVC